jgi:imidazolonepropionase-like amidohydrolase
MEAIRAATWWPAVFHGVSDRVGTIEPGRIADIIAVRGDVLRHIALLSSVDIVIKGGRRVK